MELREALDSIAVIRRRMAETEVFRGYRALPVAASAVFALVAGFLQPTLLPRPDRDVPGYVGLWSGVAFLSMAAAGLAMVLRDRVAGTSLTRPVTWLAVGQFIPCLVGAAAVTLVIVRVAPEFAWALPGLWQVFFSQGVFASCRLLPRPAFAVGVFYLAAGVATLVLARGDQALAPWAMAGPFGVGQMLSAAVLYWTLERTDGRPQP
ncbi:MAG TPA: hypothetical protein VM597_39165 [Gemmataceae bacterium]|jgi:hypothetical protein|nr:hypothetical protein [Gemmataceae bacterium]